ncbi:hypothetical protein HMPREF9151_00591 [Hoylesella saccharolytica F0055]|uniref:Lipoprotein n=1 Tax=Hoylesella saccharolytica F0055 TaxID=1127699 RepID=L1NHB8_9BACT|nr:hypothetical protein HMPREF9151_00591 [Hoylesella saccharolytica F0055]
MMKKILFLFLLGVSCNILYSCKKEKKEMPVNNISQNNNIRM